MRSLLFALAGAFLAASFARADVVLLMDGTPVEGDVWENRGVVTVRTKAGETRQFKKADVAKIFTDTELKKLGVLPPSQRPAKKTPDAAGHDGKPAAGTRDCPCAGGGCKSRPACGASCGGACAEASQPAADMIVAVAPSKEKAAQDLAAAATDASEDARLKAVGDMKGFERGKVPPEISYRLAERSVVDPSAKVRASALAAIKESDDRVAQEFLVRCAVAPQVKPASRKAAAAAIRSLGTDYAVGRVYAVYRLCTLDTNAGRAVEVTPPQIIYITNGGNVNLPAGTINLPIELPNLELSSQRTTVVVPAFEAIEAISGADFADPAAVTDWYVNWRKDRAVRDFLNQ